MGTETNRSEKHQASPDLAYDPMITYRPVRLGEFLDILDLQSDPMSVKPESPAPPIVISNPETLEERIDNLIILLKNLYPDILFFTYEEEIKPILRTLFQQNPKLKLSELFPIAVSEIYRILILKKLSIDHPDFHGIELLDRKQIETTSTFVGQFYRTENGAIFINRTLSLGDLESLTSQDCTTIYNTFSTDSLPKAS